MTGSDKPFIEPTKLGSFDKGFSRLPQEGWSLGKEG